MNKKKDNKTGEKKSKDATDVEQADDSVEPVKLTAAKLLENARRTNQSGKSGGYQDVTTRANKGSKTYARPGANRTAGRNR